MGESRKTLRHDDEGEDARERRRGALDRRVARALANSLGTKKPSTNVLTAREAAGFLKVSRQALYEAAGRAEIPHRRIGKRFVFSRAALLSWLECGYA
jgi:excisionase family DNA binding protein